MPATPASSKKIRCYRACRRSYRRSNEAATSDVIAAQMNHQLICIPSSGVANGKHNGTSFATSPMPTHLHTKARRKAGLWRSKQPASYFILMFSAGSLLLLATMSYSIRRPHGACGHVWNPLLLRPAETGECNNHIAMSRLTIQIPIRLASWHDMGAK